MKTAARLRTRNVTPPGGGSGVGGSGGLWPLSWDRSPQPAWVERTSPLYVTSAQVVTNSSIVDSTSGFPAVMDSASGYNGYTLNTFRYRGREGPRAGGASITIRDAYIEVSSDDPIDHADGIQGYLGGGMVVRNTNVMLGNGCNAALFSADNTVGLIDIDTMHCGLLPGVTEKSAWGFCIMSDGADEARIQNLYVQQDISRFDISYAFNCDVPVTVWANNYWVDQAGNIISPIPHP